MWYNIRVFKNKSKLKRKQIMKKTRKLVCAVAMLLAALMLFSACSINYGKVDPAEYVKLKDGFDLKNIEVTINKMKVDSDDVSAYVEKLLYENRKEIKTSDGKPQPGPLSLYDVLSLRTFVYDDKGNLVEHDFAINSKATDGDGEIALNAGRVLSLGYGGNINKGFLAELENTLFLKAETPFNYEEHAITFNNVGVKSAKINKIPGIGYVTYSSKYSKDSSLDTTGKSATSATPIHFAKLAENVTPGTNNYDEAIYLGMAKLFDYLEENGEELTPSGTTAITIRIYPTAKGVPAADATTATSVSVAYDIDCSNLKDGTSYKEAEIKVKLVGAIAQDISGDGAAVVSYTYPSDDTTEYTTATGAKEKRAGKKCSVYVYFEERTAYERPEHDKTFILETLKFETTLTDEEDIVEAHRESIRKELQDACDASAKKDAISRLWDKAVENAVLIKVPTADVNKYVREQMNYAKAMYYDYGYSTIYDTFESFMTKYYYTKEGDDGKDITFSSLDAIEEDLKKDGQKLVLKNLLVYYIADALEIRYTEGEILAIMQEKGAAWAKEQIDAARQEILDTYTVEKLKSTYPDTKENSTDEKTQKETLFAQYGASSYEDCLAKMLAETKCKTWDEYAKKLYPDDAANWETYVENYGEEYLHGLYHADAVHLKLYDVNLEGGNVTYKDVDYKAS